MRHLSELSDLSEWHLITSEYPPQIGGVSDYTYMVASGLAAAGDSVQVWCMPSAGDTPASAGVTVHREMGRFTPSDLRRAGRLLDQFPAPRRLLVQWVPHGYGHRSMNIWFCLWLWKRAKLDHDRVELMVHDPFLPFREGSWKQDAAAVVHRVMTIILLNAVKRVWTSIPAWESRLRPYALGREIKFGWLPIPGTIPVDDDASAASAIRARYAPGGRSLIAHFGPYIRQVMDPIVSLLPALLREHDASILLLGRGSEVLRDELIRNNSDLTERVHATGSIASAALSRHLSACDVMIQPYPDGVSTRRTSTMAGLSHGLPIITTTGDLTESLWAESNAVALVPARDMAALMRVTGQLLRDERERKRLSAAARKLYQERFDIQRTIAALRESR